MHLSGWGAEAKAEMSYSSENSFGVKDVIFIVHSGANMGYDGWDRPPPFSQSAKDMICNEN